MQKKILLIIFVLIVLASVAPKSFSYLRGVQEYSIAEKRIEMTIAEGKTVLELDDLKYLREIPANVAEIKDLWFIDARSATRLENIDAVAGLPELRHLQIGETRISDISAVSTLPKLEVLDIGGTWVEDLTPLTEPPALRWLQMNELAIQSLCPLNDVRFLQWLNLYKSYAKTDSHACFKELKRNVPELAGGSSYEQNYIPSSLYNFKVSSERFIETLEWR